MRDCCDPGSTVWLRDSGNAKRKYPLSWELVTTANGQLVGINTHLANELVREAIAGQRISELRGYSKVQKEVRYGVEKSRIDFLLQDSAGRHCYVEVKNVTLVEHGIALFPDAVSTRGTRHLRELMHVVNTGHRSVIFFCVQRQDATEVRPADRIDALYGRALRQAVAQGVEPLAYRAAVSVQGIELRQAIPVVLTPS